MSVMEQKSSFPLADFIPYNLVWKQGEKPNLPQVEINGCVKITRQKKISLNFCYAMKCVLDWSDVYLWFPGLFPLIRRLFPLVRLRCGGFIALIGHLSATTAKNQ